MFVRIGPAVIEEVYSPTNESDSAFELGSQEGKHCLDQVTQEMSALLKRLGAGGGVGMKVRENDL